MGNWSIGLGTGLQTLSGWFDSNIAFKKTLKKVARIE